MQRETGVLYWQLKFHKIFVTFYMLFQKSEEILVEYFKK